MIGDKCQWFPVCLSAVLSSDEEDRLQGSEGEASPVGVPSLEPSPRVAHALLSCRGDEEDESHDIWQHTDLNGAGEDLPYTDLHSILILRH